LSPLRRFFSCLMAIGLLCLGALGVGLIGAETHIRGLAFGAPILIAVGLYLLWNDGLRGGVD
jgi:uncharacterized membrane protein YiaA